MLVPDGPIQQPSLSLHSECQPAQVAQDAEYATRNSKQPERVVNLMDEVAEHSSFVGPSTIGGSMVSVGSPIRKIRSALDARLMQRANFLYPLSHSSEAGSKRSGQPMKGQASEQPPSRQMFRYRSGGRHKLSIRHAIRVERVFGVFYVSARVCSDNGEGCPLPCLAQRRYTTPSSVPVPCVASRARRSKRPELPASPQHLHVPVAN
jgi:hypothetical protein